MAVTNIATPAVTATNFGPPPGFDKVTKIGTGYSVGSSTPGVIGTYDTISLSIASVSNNASAVVEDSFKAPARLRVVAIEHVAQAVVATSSFLVYNSTQSANVAGSVTATTTSAIVTSLTTPTVEQNDVIQLKVTTDGTGAITNLDVKLIVQYLGSPTNAQS